MVIPGNEERIQEIREQLGKLNEEKVRLVDTAKTRLDYEARLEILETQELALSHEMESLTQARAPTAEEAEPIRWPRMIAPFKGSHYSSLQNVIGWIRALDVQLEGKKTFMVDEFQSEWAERARATGFQKFINNYAKVLERARPAEREFNHDLASLYNKLAVQQAAFADARNRYDSTVHELAQELKKEKPDQAETKKLQKNIAALAVRMESANADRAATEYQVISLRRSLDSLYDDQRRALQLEDEISENRELPPAPFIGSRRWGIVLQSGDLKGLEWENEKGQKQRFATVQEAENFCKKHVSENVAVADLGYIENTAAWAGYEFKRALRWAVEHGYDKLAWTDGATQNKRWSLSRFIHELGNGQNSLTATTP